MIRPLTSCHLYTHAPSRLWPNATPFDRRELRIQWMIGFALHTLAQGAYVGGDLAQAFTLIDESVTLFRDLKAYSSLAEVLVTQGRSCERRGMRRHTAH